MDVDSAASPPAVTAYSANANHTLHSTHNSSDASALGSPDSAQALQHAQPSNMDVSSLDEEDADDESDDDQPIRAPPRRKGPPGGEKIDLSNADPDLYGLRRSVSSTTCIHVDGRGCRRIAVSGLHHISLLVRNFYAS